MIPLTEKTKPVVGIILEKYINILEMEVKADNSTCHHGDVLSRALDDQNNFSQDDRGDQNDFSQDEEDFNEEDNLQLIYLQPHFFKLVTVQFPNQLAVSTVGQVQSHPLACGHLPPCDSSPSKSKDVQPSKSKCKRNRQTQFTCPKVPNHDCNQDGYHTKGLDLQAHHAHQDGFYWVDTHHHKGDFQHTVQNPTASQDSRQLGISKPSARDVATRTSSSVKNVYGASSFLLCSLIFQLMMLTSATAIEVVSVQPPVVVTGVGQVAVFTCMSTSTVIMNAEWLINGTPFNSVQLSDVNQMFVITLQLSSVPVEYNNTRIQCRANTTTHGVVTSGNSTLLVQGSLSAAGSLTVIRRESDLDLRWTAPFSLDANDISYCVDVVSSTSSATLHSECGITVTEFTYPLPPRSWCDVYSFTITPVNMVGNGTRASIEYPGAMSRPRLEEKIMKYMLIMSTPVCNVQLTFVDIDTGENITVGDTNLTIAETNITFTTQQLRQNRRYTVTVTASNAAGSATSNYGELLSTHDITDCSSSAGAVISAIFTQNSNATGALFNFVFISESGRSVDLSKSSCFPFNRSDVSRGLLLPLDLFHHGRYMMSVYDIENNQQLVDGIGYQASGDNNITINGLKSDQSTSDTSCNVTSLTGLITVTCVFPKFQITAQINSMDKVNVLHINTTTETQTPVTVQVVENGEYLVTVFPIQDGVGILSGMEFSQTIHMVDDIPTTQAPTTTSTTMLATSTPITSEPATLVPQNIGGLVGGVLGAVVGVVVTLISVIVCVGFLKSRERKVVNPNIYITNEEGMVRSSSITMQSSHSGPPTTTVRTVGSTYTNPDSCP